MNQPVYTISQASTLVGKKSYVLRYWEEELAIPIARNEMGHRYYTGHDVQLFLNIKELQKRGLQLRAIRELIPKLYCQQPGQSDSPVKVLPGDAGSAQNTYQSSSEEDADYVFDSSPSLDEYKMQEFQAILEKLIAQGLQEERAQARERRCRNLDESIRIHQQSRRQAAAALTPKPARRGRLFSKKKITSQSLSFSGMRTCRGREAFVMTIIFSY